MLFRSADLARDAGHDLDANRAFQWLGTGGFASDTVAGNAGIGTCSVESLKQLAQRFTRSPSKWHIAENNVFRLALEGAVEETSPLLVDGRITQEPSYARGPKRLTLVGLYGLVFSVLQEHSEVRDVVQALIAYFEENPWLESPRDSVNYAFHVLEAMIVEGWVEASRDVTKPCFGIRTLDESACIHPNFDNVPTLAA